MKSKLQIVLIFSLLILVSACDSNITTTREYREEELPRVSTSFKNIVSSGWDKNIHEMKSVFPGGKFFKGNKKKRIASQYRIYAELTDINVTGRLSFSQFGKETQSDATGQVIRSILVKNQPKEKLEEKYQEISRLIENTYNNATKIRYSNQSKVEHHIYDIEYCLLNFDNKGDVHIGIDLDISKNWLQINVTHSITVKKINCNSTTRQLT